MRNLSLALAAILLSAGAQPEPSDLAIGPAESGTLIANVNGIQVRADGKLERFAGLLIDDRTGRVKKVYGPTQGYPPLVTRAIDMGGRTLLPGLIDAHGHVIDSPGGGAGLGLFLLQLDLTGTTSIADLQSRLKAYADANPSAAWITGRGWNQELWPDKRFPTAGDLDAVVADRPVVLERVDGHAIVANSAALRIAQVHHRTMDVVGGKIDRDTFGRPTGLLIDNASALVQNRLPPPTDEQRQQGLAKAQELLLSYGITAAADMGTSVHGWRAMQAAAREGRLNIRLIAYADGLEPLKSIDDEARTWHAGDRLKLGGVKLYADGALGSRGAWLKQPYADQPDTRGLRFLTDEQMRAQAGEAARRGLQVAIHAIGDAANAQVISAFEQLGRTHTGDRRWRIEHFQIADPADIPRLAPAGIIASMQPVHQTSDRTMAEARLGPNRLGGAYAWQSVHKSGARLAFGSDFPVESPNPFPGLAAAISRQDMNAQPPGGWIPAERLSFEQALHAFTRGAAYASFAEDRLGSLEPGKWADFIIIDREPTQVDAQALARTQVLETWVAGKKVWERAPSAAVQPERGQ